MIRFILSMYVIGAALAGLARKDRVVDHPLSDKEPGSPDYDHEAFVGKEEAKKFDKLSPEESRRRLGVIVDRIDKDEDKIITEKELHDWISYTQTRYVVEDADKLFKSYDKDENNKLSWDEYKHPTYGFLSAEDLSANNSDGYSYRKMIEKDVTRWQRADIDKDRFCSISEFRSFLHPQEYDHMKDILITETMDDVDKDKDGFVTLEEYISDMYSKEDDGVEPEWVATERKLFKETRDMDKDGKMSEKEIRAWIMPDDYNHAEAEAQHLISQADDNKDGVLAKEEILFHHDIFVGSQATDWGEALKRHDEF